MTSWESLLVERALPHVPPPLWAPLSTAILFNRQDENTPKSLKARSKSSCPINYHALRIHLMKEGRVKPEDAHVIMSSAVELFKNEKNILYLKEPVTVVGDIHGQFYDLVKLLEIGGYPTSSSSGTTYLFLGDYVDRGCFSCECLLLLLALKICFPTSVFLLRGNHEARHLTTYFNFKEECLFKYSIAFYEAAIAVFDALPLAAVVGTHFFCVHGGLSPDVTHIEDINHIHRHREIPSQGAMCDLLWSDPHWDVENPTESTDGYYNFSASAAYENEPNFTPNEQRGCSYVFNFACLKHFVTENGILCVIRAHEAQDEGYRLYRSHPNTHFPAMVSIFSAPNYCDTFDNKGAIAVLADKTMRFKQFFSSPHPYYLPNFMSGLTWSLPFVLAKVRSAVAALLIVANREPIDDDEFFFPLDDEDEDDVQRTLARICAPPAAGVNSTEGGGLAAPVTANIPSALPASIASSPQAPPQHAGPSPSVRKYQPMAVQPSLSPASAATAAAGPPTTVASASSTYSPSVKQRIVGLGVVAQNIQRQ